jgi:multiple sugar transport system permease protein
MLALGLYPILRVLSFSLYKVDVFLKNQEFVGLDNLIKVITWDNFWNAVWNDVVFTLGSIAIQIILGILVATLLHRAFFGRDVARSVVMFSYLVPIVVAALVWKFMLNDIVGIVNHVIRTYNLPIPTTWFGAVGTAMPSVIMVNVWKFFPFMVLVLLAQLQSIDPVLYEAAKVDGSNAWQEFWFITLPMLMPVILIAAMLRTIWHFNDFAVIQLLTGGGPLASTETPPLMIYDIVFETWNLGLGSALAVVMFGILILMMLVYIRLFYWAQEQLN